MKTIANTLTDAKFADQFTLEISELTNREYLQLLIVANQRAIRDNHRLSYKRQWAEAELKACKERLQQLDKYVVKTPPVTPQLNLF